MMKISTIPGTPYPVALLLLLVQAAALSFPHGVRAECQELKIVEYEDRVEAVCVGEPLTEAQQKANLEEQKRQEQEARRQQVEEQNRQKEAARAAKVQTETEAAAERKKRDTKPAITQPGMTQPGMTQPGMTQPGMTQPGMTQPGMTQPGMTQPGMTQPGMNKSNPGRF